MAQTFTRMDESTAEQWAVIGKETYEHQDRVAESVLALLRSLAAITDGFAVDQLTHSLQTATRAERAGADDEVVFASLLHDIGKAVSVPNHPEIAAAIIKPYVRSDVYNMIRAHQDFQGRHYYAHFGGDPERARPVRGRAVVRSRGAVRRRLGSGRVRSRLRHACRSSTSNRSCAPAAPSRSSRHRARQRLGGCPARRRGQSESAERVQRPPWPLLAAGRVGKRRSTSRGARICAPERQVCAWHGRFADPFANEPGTTSGRRYRYEGAAWSGLCLARSGDRDRRVRSAGDPMASRRSCEGRRVGRSSCANGELLARRGGRAVRASEVRRS